MIPLIPVLMGPTRKPHTEGGATFKLSGSHQSTHSSSQPRLSLQSEKQGSIIFPSKYSQKVTKIESL